MCNEHLIQRTHVYTNATESTPYFLSKQNLFDLLTEKNTFEMSYQNKSKGGNKGRNGNSGSKFGGKQSKDNGPSCHVTITASTGTATYETVKGYKTVTLGTDTMRVFQMGRNPRSNLPKQLCITVGDLSDDAYLQLAKQHGCRPDQRQAETYDGEPAFMFVHELNVSTMKDLRQICDDVIRAATIQVTSDDKLNFDTLVDDVDKVSEEDATNLFRFTLQTDGPVLESTIASLNQQSFVVDVEQFEDDELSVIVRPNYDLITFFINTPGSRTPAWGLGQNKDQKQNYTSNPDSWNESICAVLSKVVEPRIDFSKFKSAVRDGPVKVELAMKDIVHTHCIKPSYRKGAHSKDPLLLACNKANEIAKLLKPHMVVDGDNIQVADGLANVIRTLSFIGVMPKTEDGVYAAGRFMQRLCRIYKVCIGKPVDSRNARNVGSPFRTNNALHDALNALVNYKLPFEVPATNKVLEVDLWPVELGDEVDDEQVDAPSEDEEEVEADTSVPDTVVVVVHQPSAALQAAEQVLE